MNKTYRTEFRRVFLLQNLPEPLTRASEHLQFFDNFIENTKLCLRSIRAPHTKEWTWILEKRERLEENDLAGWKISEIFLDEAEHQAFEHFEGREVKKNERVETGELRFNRYFYEFDEKKYEIDVFLNPLWGLTLAAVYLESEKEAADFKTPAFALADVTQNSFFLAPNLIGRNFADVQAEFQKLQTEKAA